MQNVQNGETWLHVLHVLHGFHARAEPFGASGTGGTSETCPSPHVCGAAYVVSDGVSVGHGNRIPLWLFGFLY